MEMKRVKRKNHGRSGLSRGVWERRRQPRLDSGDDCSPANDKDRLHQINPEQPPRNPCRPQRHDHGHTLPEEKMLATNHDQTNGKKIRPVLTTRDFATTLKLISPLALLPISHSVPSQAQALSKNFDRSSVQV